MTSESQQNMDDAANKAEQDLENIPNDVVMPMAEWMKRWYGTAGYKRLGRILANIANRANQ